MLYIVFSNLIQSYTHSYRLTNLINKLCEHLSDNGRCANISLTAADLALTASVSSPEI